MKICILLIYYSLPFLNEIQFNNNENIIGMIISHLYEFLEESEYEKLIYRVKQYTDIPDLYSRIIKFEKNLDGKYINNDNKTFNISCIKEGDISVAKVKYIVKNDIDKEEDDTYIKVSNNTYNSKSGYVYLDNNDCCLDKNEIYILYKDKLNIKTDNLLSEVIYFSIIIIFR